MSVSRLLCPKNACWYWQSASMCPPHGSMVLIARVSFISAVVSGIWVLNQLVMGWCWVIKTECVDASPHGSKAHIASVSVISAVRSGVWVLGQSVKGYCWVKMTGCVNVSPHGSKVLDARVSVISAFRSDFWSNPVWDWSCPSL